jgi:hypothetical protein
LLPFGEMELVGAASADHGKTGGGAFAAIIENQLFSFGTSVKVRANATPTRVSTPKTAGLG